MLLRSYKALLAQTQDNGVTEVMSLYRLYRKNVAFLQQVRLLLVVVHRSSVIVIFSSSLQTLFFLIIPVFRELISFYAYELLSCIVPPVIPYCSRQHFISLGVHLVTLMDCRLSSLGIARPAQLHFFRC